MQKEIFDLQLLFTRTDKGSTKGRSYWRWLIFLKPVIAVIHLVFRIK